MLGTGVARALLHRPAPPPAADGDPGGPVAASARPGSGARRLRLPDVSLCVDVLGHGPPIVFMHGGPGADHWTLEPAFRPLADRYTLVFYDHRCNGRSVGPPVSSMTWEHLTADADALREALGFEQWTVLGHSFGGHVALEYALRYPGRVSRLILLDTGGAARWSQEHAAEVVAARGGDAKQVALVRRWFTGEFAPREFFPILLRIGDAYASRPSLRRTLHGLLAGGWRARPRPEALIFAGRHLLRGWSVMDRLGAIAAPTLVMAGRDDFIFPPEHQQELAAAIPGARLRIVEGAGHNPYEEQPDEVLDAVRAFMASTAEASIP